MNVGGRREKRERERYQGDSKNFGLSNWEKKEKDKNPFSEMGRSIKNRRNSPFSSLSNTMVVCTRYVQCKK